MKLFIGCGSTNNIKDAYFSDCSAYLNKLLKENDLIFGACNSGLMGKCYTIAKENKNKVIGIAPIRFLDDLSNIECDEEIITKNISQRTLKLIDESDAIIFLPGGIGTIYELFTAIELKRSCEFNKPIIIYNLNHYFDKLLEFLSFTYEENFSNTEIKSTYHVSYSINDTLDYLSKYKS